MLHGNSGDKTGRIEVREVNKMSVPLSRAFAALFFCTAIVVAQTCAVEGDVRNELGEPFKSAVIVIDREDAKGHFQTKADSKGHYYHAGLPIGTYTLSVVVDGKPIDRVADVRFRLGNPLVINFDLAYAAKQRAAFQARRTLQSPQNASPAKPLSDQETQPTANKMLNETYNAGMKALFAHDYETAIRTFQHAIEIDPNQPGVWYFLASAYDGAGSAEKALESYLKAIGLKPDDSVFHASYAFALVRAKRFDEARLELTDAALLDPSNAGRNYYYLGNLFVKAEQYDRAERAFKAAAEGGYAEAYFQYAVALTSKATISPDGKIKPPTGTIESFQKYMLLLPEGPNIEQACAFLLEFGVPPQVSCRSRGARPSQSASSATLPIQRGVADSSLPSGLLKLALYNQTPYSIGVNLSGPTSQQLQISAGEIGNAVLQRGRYSIQMSTSAPNVDSQVSTYTFDGGYLYSSIITIGR